MAEVYDGFISYSHAADGLLAPRLQSALQRFAKPWWKRRAVRIFRDESSLSANPHLWSSITEALDSSGWFVLLLSPDAARSEWVNQEIAYWVSNRDASKVLPVVTDGTFGWGDGDVTGDAVPDSLQGVFSEEPRWVDVRWAKDGDQLDLKDPRFADAIADIASTVRGVPKDDLASEEVRQHRRTVRTAWAAGALVTVLAIAAVGFGVQAGRNADEAERLAAIAEQNAAAEFAARTEADANAQQAQASAAAEAQARLDAEQQARLARARELGVASVEALDEDPELSTLLALEAIAIVGSAEDQPEAVRNAIWRSVQNDHLEFVVTPEVGEGPQIDISPDDRLLAIAGDASRLAILDAGSGEQLWTYEEDTADTFTHPLFSADGSRVALTIADSTSLTYPGRPEGDDAPNRIVILDAANGTVLGTVTYPECTTAWAWGWSTDGTEFLVSSGFEECARSGTDGVWVEVLDGATLESRFVFDFPDPNGWLWPSFTDGGEIVILGAFSDPQVRSGDGYRTVRVLEGAAGGGAVSRDGRLALTFNPSTPQGQVLRELPSGAQIDILKPLPAFPALPNPAVFSDDGSLVATTTEGREVLVWSTVSGEVLFRLPGGAGGNPVFDSTGQKLYTSHRDGTVKLWDLSPRTLGQTVVDQLRPQDHVQANRFSVGPGLAATEVVDFEDFGFRTVFFEPGTGRLVAEVAGYVAPLSLGDGRFLLQAQSPGEIVTYDPKTGDMDLFAGCVSSSVEEPFLCDETGEEQASIEAVVSLDGSEVMVYDRSGTWKFIDTASGESTSSGDGVTWNRVAAFNKDWIVGWTSEERVMAIDRDSGEELAVFDAPFVPFEISRAGDLLVVPHDGRIEFLRFGSWEFGTIRLDFDRVRGIAFSDDDRFLALGDENAIHIVDLGAEDETQSIPIGGASDFLWLDGSTLLLGTSNPARWVTVSLDVSGIADAALSSLTRGFTELECREYGIEPCPTTIEAVADRLEQQRG